MHNRVKAAFRNTLMFRGWPVVTPNHPLGFRKSRYILVREKSEARRILPRLSSETLVCLLKR